jgi:hypothetical protein
MSSLLTCGNRSDQYLTAPGPWFGDLRLAPIVATPRITGKGSARPAMLTCFLLVRAPFPAVR